MRTLPRLDVPDILTIIARQMSDPRQLRLLSRSARNVIEPDVETHQQAFTKIIADVYTVEKNRLVSRPRGSHDHLVAAIDQYGYSGGIHDPFREDPATTAHLKAITRSYIYLLHLKHTTPATDSETAIYRRNIRQFDSMLSAYFKRMQEIYVAMIQRRRDTGSTRAHEHPSDAGAYRYLFASAHTKPFVAYSTPLDIETLEHVLHNAISHSPIRDINRGRNAGP